MPIEVRRFGPLVSAEWLAEHLGEDGLAVVDCRWSLDAGPGRAAYEAGHIPSAVFADLDVDLSAPPSVDAGRHPLPTPDAFAAAMGRLGIGDHYVEHGEREELMADLGLDPTGIAQACREQSQACAPGHGV